MVAGLAFQVFTLLIFMFLCADFALRTRRRYKSMGEAAFDQNPMYVAIRHDWKFKAFLVALTLATICIFWRSVYRVVELGEGWTGALIRRQNLFIAFEGVMVIIAAAALNIFHPAICFREGVSGLGGLGTKRKQQKAEARAEKEGTVGRTEMAATEARSGSGSNSDVELKPETQTAARSAVV